MVKGWSYSNKKSSFSKLRMGLSGKCGFVYAVRVDVAPGFSLLKIGATRAPNVRFENYYKNATLFCVSPPCINFFENEEILHEFFSKYRVPPKPGRGSKAEYFNLRMPYFLKHLPALNYEQEK